MSIEIRDLNKRFGALTVCDNVNLTIGSGELVALLGPSGSGKTTLLRMIAGLEVPDAGQVLFQGEDATDASVRERLGLRPGSTVHLKPRRITRFDASGTNVADDPAAAI